MSKEHPKVNPNRKGTYQDKMLRLGIKDKMQKAIDEGNNFNDAAELAGVPYELALANTRSDDDFHRMYMECKGRDTRLRRTFPSSVYRSSAQVKEDFLNMLCDAGLFEKITAMAAAAEPGTKDGDKILIQFMSKVLPLMLPKEVKREERVLDLKGMTDDELMKLLVDKKSKRIEGDVG